MHNSRKLLSSSTTQTSTWEAEAVVSGVQDYPDYILSLSLSRETLDPVSKNNDSKTECF